MFNLKPQDFMGSRVNVEDSQSNTLLTVSHCATPSAGSVLPVRQDISRDGDGDGGVWDIVCKVSSVFTTFQNAIDLLSPVALLQFSAIQRQANSPSPEGMQTLKVLGLVYFLYLFLFSGLEYTLSFLTHQRFHFNSMQQGKMFFFVGITMALVQGGYARRIQPGNEVKAVKRAIALLIPAFLIIGWANTVLILYIGLLFYSF
eukprot:g43245.t1